VKGLPRVLRGAILLAALVTLIAAADATILEPNRITTTVVDLPPGPLASALDGQPIVHLSDLHLKGIGIRERRLVETIRERRPALILMTGDYADTEAGVAAIRTLFSEIHAPLGVVAVPGNNDYFRGRQEEIFAALRDTGVRLLVNEAAVIEGPGGPFAVAGVDDPFFGRDDTAGAIAQIPEGLPAILIAHSPAVMMEREEAILFNAGDADGPWGVGAFWQDGTHFRPRLSAVRFAAGGEHVMRLQRREDGVGVAAVRLVPEAVTGSSASTEPRGLQGIGKTPPDFVPGQIDFDLCGGAVSATGSWTLEREANGTCVLHDRPDPGDLESFPRSDPEDRVDIRFEAPEGVSYRVWLRLVSPTATGRSDSVFVQFGDAVDGSGNPIYRVGRAIPPADSKGLELVLAGHTHGGQVRIPFKGPVEQNLSRGPFVMGRYDLPGRMLYISRGIGTSYLPLRFACPPEVVVLRSPRRGEPA
jgi:predicted MPP superfamily phosphohydrolase